MTQLNKFRRIFQKKLKLNISSVLKVFVSTGNKTTKSTKEPFQFRCFLIRDFQLSNFADKQLNWVNLGLIYGITPNLPDFIHSIFRSKLVIINKEIPSKLPSDTY